MRELLPLLPKPSHYLGCEPGTVHKNPESVAVRIGLAFPDMYEIGMSYLGGAILYDAVNKHEDFWAERVYTPSQEAGAVIRDRGANLGTMESGTPIRELDVLTFSLTHELCYTNVLYILDLGGIPMRAADRSEDDPIIMMGGGCTFNAEPMAPFADLMVLGDGEEILPELCAAIRDAKASGMSKSDLLYSLRTWQGVYIPSFFEDQGFGLPPRPIHEDHTVVQKRIVQDMNKISFPLVQPQAFDAVHDRYTIEIARGCTRGCRFCQAGMIYRPVRERSLDTLDDILQKGLSGTGYGELSFLSLSAGDFSALTGLFDVSINRCRDEQVGVSLPSLRAGSVSEDIMERIANIRRTGATIAPEAGTQRLRDVINKGITEDELLDHVRTLIAHGWTSVKLYFMIGLPTETQEDLDGILELCKKVLYCAGPKPGRFQVSAAVSPFVPKPHTPFQWERQLSYDECRERIYYLRDIFRPHKRFRLRSHIPEMTQLEGVFSRGGRELAPLVEKAYERGALFCSWKDHLDISVWRELWEELGIDHELYLAERPMDEPLPWDHLSSGVTKRFFAAERRRALQHKITEDCRYGACRNCGVCTIDGRPSELNAGKESPEEVTHILNRTTRDQVAPPKRTSPEVKPIEPAGKQGSKRPDHTGKEELFVRAAQFRVWYRKHGAAAYLSQLELQSILERAMRRAKLPIAFSAGFHPLPLLSFSRALSVGIASDKEYFHITLREPMDAEAMYKAFAPELPAGMTLLSVEEVRISKKQPQAIAETFELSYIGDEENRPAFVEAWRSFEKAPSYTWLRKSKRGEKEMNLRPVFTELSVSDNDGPDGTPLCRFTLDWSEAYIGPLAICRAVYDADLTELKLVKKDQHFA